MIQLSYEKEKENKRRDMYFILALKLNGGWYEDILQINKVNKRYRQLLDSYRSEIDMLLLEKRLFEVI